jgi:hypothetical protein
MSSPLRPRNQKSLKSIRAENARRSLAAGAPVGTQSELHGVSQQQLLRDTRAKKSQEKKRKRLERGAERERRLKGVSGDLMGRGTRLPGSFENGKGR